VHQNVRPTFRPHRMVASMASVDAAIALDAGLFHQVLQ
jgi:hypothetical protein